MDGERPAETKFRWVEDIMDSSGSERYSRTELDPEEDLAFLVYSSGTTGKMC